MKDFKIFQLVEAFRKGIMVEMNKKLTMLMILDGFGNNQNKNGNAIEMAEIPNINKLKKKHGIHWKKIVYPLYWSSSCKSVTWVVSSIKLSNSGYNLRKEKKSVI